MSDPTDPRKKDSKLDERTTAANEATLDLGYSATGKVAREAKGPVPAPQKPFGDGEPQRSAERQRTLRNETLQVPGSEPPSPDEQTGPDRKSLTEIRDAGKPRQARQPLPDRISRYETISLLGEGSFGLVLKSHDPRLDRLVAVKIQKLSAIPSSSGVDRFLREARSAAQLRHPNIVPVFEYGDFADNQFIVYQFIEGKTLAEWIRDSRPSRRQLIEIFARIADALDYAHALGIVHRDIKPANILVDGNDNPHVADFGCARMETVDIGVTVDGSLMGTPAYMSPEMVAGHASSADGRADIWAIGVMMYEALCGQRPFRGKITDLFQSIPRDAPRPPRQIDRTVPVDLQTVCLKCLEKDPARRYDTGRELADDLRRWLDGMPVLARRASVPRRLWLWAKRRPGLATLLVALFGTLILISSGSTLFSLSLRQKQNELVASQMASLASADSTALPLILESLARLDPNVADQLRGALGNDPDATLQQTARHRIAAWYLQQQGGGTADPELLSVLTDYLPTAPAAEVEAILKLAGDHLEPYADTFRQTAHQAAAGEGARLRAWCVLAAIDADDPAWGDRAGEIAGLLLGESAEQLETWTALLQPVALHLLTDLEAMYSGSSQPAVREKSAEVLGLLFRNDVDRIGRWALAGEPRQLQRLGSAIRRNAAGLLRWSEQAVPETAEPVRHTNWAILRSLAGDSAELTGQLASDNEDATLRSLAIARSAQCGIDRTIPEGILQDDRSAATLLYSSLLVLGEYDQQQLYLTERQRLLSRILDVFRNHPDSGVHSAAAWLLRKWEFEKELATSTAEIQTPEPLPGFGWHEDPCGLCFAVFETDKPFQLGPVDRETSDSGFDRRKVTLPARFALSTTEVTAAEFLQSENRLAEQWESQTGEYAEAWSSLVAGLRRNQKNRGVGESSRPAANVTWHDAAMYCYQLSDRTGLELCYRLMPYSVEWLMRPEENSLERNGYRLPVAAEWEFASRGGANTPRFAGTLPELLDGYAWSVTNSSGELMPVGILKPNRAGLFDCQGNAEEWCHNIFDPAQLESETEYSYPREIRDQSCAEEQRDFSVFRRRAQLRENAQSRLGFRLARTWSPAGG